ncbi:MAG: hypothetical protein R3212_12775, partial [Xanthomonadales bacterium]|nr:hypothetical protein [Xanthomonadales bacterium]
MDHQGKIESAPAYERFLRVFADVHPREGATSLILVANIFLILLAFYLVKPVRDGWLAVTEIGDLTSLEIKAYSAFAQSIVLLGILPVYARLAARLSRRNLILGVGIVFGVLLVAFWLSQPNLLLGRSPVFGILFYLFVGIFSVILVAQFWAFTTDVYGAERGARLFPLVAIGAALGATVGSWLGRKLILLPAIDAFDMILVALLPLAASLALAIITDRRGAYGDPSQWTTERWQQPAAPESQGPFRLIFKHRYLTATAAMIMIFTWVVTSGDNILFGIVRSELAEELASLAANPIAFEKALQEATATFYGDLYFWVNLITLILQAFVVSRILNAGGMQALLYATPFISLAAYASMIFMP